MGEQSIAFKRRSIKLLILFVALVVFVVVFVMSAVRTIGSDRHLPAQIRTIHDRALRGEVISQDHYTLSLPHKIYKAIIFAPSIDPTKQDIFVRLFSIYSGIPESTIRKSFTDKHGKLKKGYVTITDDIDTSTALSLKSLAYKLRRLNVFQPIKNHHGINIVHGLDIIESGEEREFLYSDVLEPTLGYIKHINDGKYVGVKGVKGIERRYQKYLSMGQDGFVRGLRDASGIVMRNRTYTQGARIDGMNIHLNIPLSLQKRVEQTLDQYKAITGAREIIAAVMESHTGRIISLASTNRYDPEHIRQADIPRLDPKFAEYPYEAGSVIKPITLAIALEHHKVTPQTIFDTHGGKLKIGEKYTISDDEAFGSLTATDIIVHSSNVGISKISWRLTGKQMYDGFTKFGLGQPSGIDLSRELSGKIKSIKKLSNKLHRANQAYGYGMQATFAQMLKAYSAFNNDGIAVTPRIVDYLENQSGHRYFLKPKYDNQRAIDAHTASQLHNILKQVVKRGTGTKAQYPGLEIGGKTGTALITIHGEYREIYNSSFYGFANDDKGHKYTIGVLVIRASKPKMYYASRSAVPTFRAIVDVLVDQEYLEPNLTLIQKQQKAARAKKQRALMRKKQQERTRKIKAKLKAQREAILRQQQSKQRSSKSSKSKHKRRQASPAMHPVRTSNPKADSTKPPEPTKRSRTPHDMFPDMF